MNNYYVSIRKTSAVVVFSFLFLVLITSLTSAQNTYAQKIKVKGGAEPGEIIGTTDGGNALLFVDGIGKRVLLRKVNASGKKVWQRELHLKESQSSNVGFVGSGVAELSDGGYILTGNTLVAFSYLFDADPWLVKLNAAGRIDWQKRFFETGDAPVLNSVAPSSDGGFFTAGNRGPEFLFPGNSGVLVASFDSSGLMRWGKVYGDNVFPSLSKIFITSDEKLIVVSSIFSPHEAEETLILKLDSDGNLLWKQLLRKKNASFLSGTVTDDGGCVLNFSSGGTHVLLVRISSNGDVLWKNRFRVDSQNSEGSAVTQSGDGSFAVTGTVFSTDAKTKGFVAKLSSNGQVISGMISEDAVDFPKFILPAPDSGFVVFGTSESPFLLKLDSNANLPGCNLFSSATIQSRSFGTLKTSAPNITINNWTPQEANLDTRTKKLKVISSQFCP